MTHNQVNYFNAVETKRSHLAGEALQAEANQIGWMNAESNRINAQANAANVAENARHNLVMEQISQQNANTQYSGMLASGVSGVVNAGANVFRQVAAVSGAAAAGSLAGYKIASAAAGKGYQVTNAAGQLLLPSLGSTTAALGAFLLPGTAAKVKDALTRARPVYSGTISGAT